MMKHGVEGQQAAMQTFVDAVIDQPEENAQTRRNAICRACPAWRLSMTFEYRTRKRRGDDPDPIPPTAESLTISPDCWRGEEPDMGPCPYTDPPQSRAETRRRFREHLDRPRMRSKAQVPNSKQGADDPPKDDQP